VRFGYLGKGEKRLIYYLDHLTSFALLLQGGNKENGDPCSSVSSNNTLSWLTLGFVAAAIFVVLISIVLVEILFRWKISKREREFTRMSKTVSEADQEGK
jgi:hypothetical protein